MLTAWRPALRSLVSPNGARCNSQGHRPWDRAAHHQQPSPKRGEIAIIARGECQSDFAPLGLGHMRDFPWSRGGALSFIHN